MRKFLVGILFCFMAFPVFADEDIAQPNTDMSNYAKPDIASSNTDMSNYAQPDIAQPNAAVPNTD